jgi:hypothetical protein
MFSLDFGILIFRLLPSYMRKVLLIAYLRLLVSPIEQLKARFDTQRNTNLYKLQWGRSKIAVTNLLRTEFNDDTIELVTLQVQNAEYVVSPKSYNTSTPRLGIAYLRPASAAVTLIETQLQVRAPGFVQAEEDKLKAILKDYLHVGFTYTINYV